MGWEDRRYENAAGGGGFKAVVRRVFGGGENWMDWAITLYTAWGIRVRLHWFFVIMIGIELISSIVRDKIGLPYVAIAMGSLWGLVLLHEYGHCIACRRVGGTANDILMWPLGGLASCAPPHNWRASFITTAGGPLVNLLLWPVFGLMLVALGQPRSVLIFNPFDPGVPLGDIHASAGMYWVVVAIWWLYFTNAALFCFNMLLPMYPMDCGRLIQELMWRKMGYRKATIISVNVGLGVAVVVLLAAVNMSSTTLLGIALFGGSTCLSEKRRLAMSGDDSFMGYDFERGYSSLPSETDTKVSEKAREKRAKKEEEDQAELDRILAKIAKTGMGSLTKGEKKWLAAASERRRVG